MIEVFAFNLTAKITDGVYLHGKLCDDLFFDLCEVRPVPTKPGVYPCNVNTPAGATINAILYFWVSTSGTNRGLIVGFDDEEGNKEASAKFFSGTDVL